MTTTSLYGPVQVDLHRVEAELQALKEVDFPWLRAMLGHVLAPQGKRLRPALALLAGRVGSYPLEHLVPLAASIELLHTATLVHDDVIDAAHTRRGRPSANSLYDNGPTVMLGDYMFAKAAELVARTGNVRVVRLFAATLVSIATGELNQDLSAYDSRLDVQKYLRRIGGKTAALFAAATEGGAVVAEVLEGQVGALREYGYNLGMAFQVVDDILDLTGSEEELGKPVGSDLMQGTLTLPSILLKESRPGDNPVERLFAAPGSEPHLQQAIAMIRSSDILERCHRVAADFGAAAAAALETLPPGETRETLRSLVGYVLQRQQ